MLWNGGKCFTMLGAMLLASMGDLTISVHGGCKMSGALLSRRPRPDAADCVGPATNVEGLCISITVTIRIDRHLGYGRRKRVSTSLYLEH